MESFYHFVMHTHLEYLLVGIQKCLKYHVLLSPCSVDIGVIYTPLYNIFLSSEHYS